VRFRATLALHGKTATGIEVPADVVESLGAGKKPPVRVSLNGHTYRSTVASRGGHYLVGVSAENRAAAGVSAGEELDVEIELDTELREIEVPGELAALLAADPAARAAFEALSNSRKQRLTLPIEAAKTDETRQRRVARAMEELRG
jgi:hypothetical protein